MCCRCRKGPQAGFIQSVQDMAGRRKADDHIHIVETEDLPAGRVPAKPDGFPARQYYIQSVVVTAQIKIVLPPIPSGCRSAQRRSEGQ